MIKSLARLGQRYIHVHQPQHAGDLEQSHLGKGNVSCSSRHLSSNWMEVRGETRTCSVEPGAEIPKILSGKSPPEETLFRSIFAKHLVCTPPLLDWSSSLLEQPLFPPFEIVVPESPKQVQQFGLAPSSLQPPNKSGTFSLGEFSPWRPRYLTGNRTGNQNGNMSHALHPWRTNATPGFQYFPF